MEQGPPASRLPLQGVSSLSVPADGERRGPNSRRSGGRVGPVHLLESLSLSSSFLLFTGSPASPPPRVTPLRGVSLSPFPGPGDRKQVLRVLLPQVPTCPAWTTNPPGAVILCDTSSTGRLGREQGAEGTDPLPSVAAHECSQGFLAHWSPRQKHRVPSALHTVSFVSSLAVAYATALMKSWLAFFPDKARAVGGDDKAEVSMMKEMIGLRFPKERGISIFNSLPSSPVGHPVQRHVNALSASILPGPTPAFSCL